jgi:DNA topoisomerase-1
MSNFKNKITTSLVIVESPAKCKKIESYLGPGYKCLASFGHLRQLKSLTNIDIKNNFKPTFDLCDDDKKRKHIDFLRKEISKADDIILASDDDREGEAIAWHICDLFGLPVQTTKRIVFHEITENAIQSAIAHPKTIDMQKVNSQIARQILDLLVGYNISPMLWKFISKTSDNSLSAGRCQTPALKLVYENQMDINNSPAQKVYNTIGYFTNKCIVFDLNKQFENEELMTEFLEESVNHSHIYSRSIPERVYKQPPEPLTTSRIQQLASNELHISPKETMKYCQTLYESGYITYMRTDSKKYSGEFLDQARNYIIKEYVLEKFVNPKIESLSNVNSQKTNSEIEVTVKKKTTKNKSNAPPPQEAHEAIRPTNLAVKNVPDEMGVKEKKLYKMIWETTIESCMAPAEYFSFTSTITSPHVSAKYSLINELIDFLGWKIIKNKETKTNKEKEYNYLLQLPIEREISFKKITSKVTLKNNKQHYTEAKLVQLLEDNGIGRPSTFSSLVDKIQERGYVKKCDVIGKEIICKDFELENDTITESSTVREFGNEKNKLIIQPLGIIVIDFLNKNFNELFAYDYTKNMEDDLDKISKGEKVWHTLCENCLIDINKSCDKLVDEKKLEIRIDDEHFYIIGKHGPVIKCIKSQNIEKTETSNKTENKTANKGKKYENVTFIPVKDGIDLKKLEKGEYKLEDIIATTKQNQLQLGIYKTEPLIIKKGKFGLYVTWGQNSKSLSCFGNRPIENVTLEDVLEILEKSERDSSQDTSISTSSPSSGVIRFITNDISIRNGKYGPYVFYKTKKMTKPLFYKLTNFEGDYKTCTISTFLEWLKTEHELAP